VKESHSKRPRLEYIGGWCEVKGREGEKAQTFRPLEDTTALCIAVKNTGTTPIKHFTWQQISNLSHMKMDLLHPKMPAKVWRPFAGNLLASTFGRDVTIEDGQVTMVNPAVGRPLDIVVQTPITDAGIMPGETLILMEKEKPYVEYLEEGMKIKGAELGTTIVLKVLNADKGTMHITIKEFKFGLITFHDMKARIVLKGDLTTVHEVLIDGEVHDSKDVTWTYI